MDKEPEHFPYLEEAFEFRASLTPETDRGCALMAAAYLNDQLERLLRAVLVDDAPVVNQLLQPFGPLGSFSARIEAGYAFGLVPANARGDLHLIRKIRNEFGHVAKPISFTNAQIADRCRELCYAAFERDAAPRKRFTHDVMAVAALIHFSIHRAVHQTIPKDITLNEETKREWDQLVEFITTTVRALADDT